jgi:hypothetical protein
MSARAGLVHFEDVPRVRVTLTFETYETDLVRHGGDDFVTDASEGITVESCAAALVAAHDSCLGYIGWKVER